MVCTELTDRIVVCRFDIEIESPVDMVPVRYRGARTGGRGKGIARLDLTILMENPEHAVPVPPGAEVGAQDKAVAVILRCDARKVSRVAAGG